MKKEILEYLIDSKGYVSGQMLCDKFGVSRTAIWKVISALKEEGYDIDSIPRKGYQLKRSADVLTSSEIGSRLDSVWLGKNLYCYDTIDSTNTEIKRLAENGAPHGTLAVAEMQTAGKGRRGRSWLQYPGSMLSFSFLLRPEISTSKASMLTILGALAVSRGIEKICGIRPDIKWPNDILVNDKKICGILTEMTLEMTAIQYVVVGIGINVNIKDFPDEISNIAGSLYLETGKPIHRASLLCECIHAYEELYERFIINKDLSFAIDEYNSKLINFGRQVKVLDPQDEYCGVCEGMDSEGQLLVRVEDGSIKEVYAGEVSVRGIYGYV